MKIYAVGGYNEIGKNMSAVEAGYDAVILDMGIHLENYVRLTDDDEIENISVKDLQKAGAIVSAMDPIAEEAAKRVLPGIRYCASVYDCAEKADALVVLTEWNDFKELDFKRLKTLMARPLMVDGRNIYSREKLEALGFEYHGIGQ